MDMVSLNHYSITTLLGAGTFGDAFTASVSTDMASFSSSRLLSSDRGTTVDAANTIKNKNNHDSMNDTVINCPIPEPRRYTQAVIKRSLVVPHEMLDRNDNRLHVEVTGNGTLTGPYSESREVAMSKLLGFKYDARQVIETEINLQSSDTVNSSFLTSTIPSVPLLFPGSHSVVTPSNASSFPPNQTLHSLFQRMVPLPIIPTLHEAFFAYDTTFDQAPQENSNTLSARSTIIKQAVQNRKGNISLLQVSEPFGRDLWSWVTKFPSKLANDGLRRNIIRQVFTLLARMHQQNFIHRDIKLANILLEFTADQEPLVRFCDMGCVRPAPDTEKGEFATPYVCSRYYRAPELLCGSSQYSTPVDIWATATSLIEMYMQLDALLDGNVAAEVSLGRGNGSEDFDPNDSQTMSRRRCVLFPGVATDAHQIIHIFNLLGVPTAEDIEGLRVPDWSEAWLRRMGRFINTCASLEAANRFDLLDRYASFATQVHHRIDTEPVKTGTTTNSNPTNTAVNRRSSGTARGFFAPVAYPPDAIPTSTKNESKFYMCKLAPDVDSRHDPDMAKAFATIKPIHVETIDMVQFLTERYIPPDLADLFARMLHWNPRKRMTAEEALFHPALLQVPYIPKALHTKLNDSTNGSSSRKVLHQGNGTGTNERDSTGNTHSTPSKSTSTNPTMNDTTGNTSQYVARVPSTNNTTYPGNHPTSRTTVHPLTAGLTNTSAPYSRYTVSNNGSSMVNPAIVTAIPNTTTSNTLPMMNGMNNDPTVTNTSSVMNHSFTMKESTDTHNHSNNSHNISSTNILNTTMIDTSSGCIV